MEIDMNVNDILREMITFLECLRDAQLPVMLENLREKLLARSKNTLRTVATMTRASSSSEPYLDMKSGPRSLLLRNEGDLEEYVGMEESNSCANTHQDYYYETFDNKNQATSEHREEGNEEDEAQVLVAIYKNLSAMQVRSKCHKCGPLHRKEGKKLFLSESRACWIALVGSHLLIYRSERHNRPYAIYPIHGYMARPAPNVVSRDRRKSESAFEIYSPGNETLQFIARTPRDMDQWVTKICEVVRNRSESEGNKNREKKKYAVESPSMDHCKNNDETTFVNDKSTLAKDELMRRNNKDQVGRKNLGKKNEKKRAPPLPARIPRKLPSLPPTNSLAVSSFKVTIEAENNNCNDEDEDDDDDIYHRIEDLRNKTRYENMVLLKKQQAGDEKSDEGQKETYDDVLASKEKNRLDSHAQEAKSCDTKSLQETYDDVVGLSRLETASVELKQSFNNETPIVDCEKKEEFYDDVQNLISTGKIAKSLVKDQIEMSSKLQKKSFLDRVLSRRDSPGKLDKKERHYNKDKVLSSSLDTGEMPTYDDVSDLTTNQENLADGVEELSEYNCPPPPRPIYERRLPTESKNNLNETQEFYDDILNAYQEQRDKTHQQIIFQSHQISAKETGCNAMQNAELKAKNSSTEEEVEHYQSPKSDLCVLDPTQINQNEQLYDDIALWADFTTRRRDLFEKSDDSKSSNSDKKYWSRFAVNRKLRFTNDFSCTAETNKRNEAGDVIEDSFENNGPVKKNTFQKLISRMENSFSKVSVRSSSLSTGKPSISNSSL